MPAAPLYPAEFLTALISPAQRKRRKNHRTVTMPERVGPHVKLVFSEMSRLRVTYDETEERSGVRRATIKAWRRKNRPGLESLEAVLGFLGWGFVPVPALEALPADIAGELVTITKRLERDIPTTFAALIDIGVTQKLLRLRSEDRAAILADHDARMTGHANDNTQRKCAASAT